MTAKTAVLLRNKCHCNEDKSRPDQVIGDCYGGWLRWHSGEGIYKTAGYEEVDDTVVKPACLPTYLSIYLSTSLPTYLPT